MDSPEEVLREARRMVRKDGKVVLGLVLRNNPWGTLYQELGRQGHRFYSHATFYSFPELVDMAGRAGLAVQRVVSTLFQQPGQVKEVEAPKEGLYLQAGFTIVQCTRLASVPQEMVEDHT